MVIIRRQLGLGNNNGFGDSGGGGGGGGGGYVFTNDIPVILSGSKTLGKYVNGQTIPAVGKTPQQVWNDVAAEYLNPAFSSFQVSGQPQTVEVGTTLSGSKTFTWGVNPGSGVVPTIDIIDASTASVLLAGTPNDGSQAQVITTRQLNSNGAVQGWYGRGNNTSPAGTFNSGVFNVVSRFILFQGPVAAIPADSAAVRAMPSSQFYQGASTLILNTGTTLKDFAIALPPGVTISLVMDQNVNANLTAQYVLVGTRAVIDAGGTARTYNLYVMSQAVPYSDNHLHAITFN